MTEGQPDHLRPPEISVVVATHNRADRFEQLLASLRSQTLSRDRFELVVVDDASSDGTRERLEAELASRRLPLRVIHRERARGPAAARNQGWLAARGPWVAFIDDDCIAASDWLAEGLAACRARPGTIVQGAVSPIPGESASLSPLARTLRIEEAGPYYETCNIFYPRALLSELEGFDTSFTMPGGEDTDLAWRAISQGVPTAFAPDARAYHAVHVGVRGRLRVAAHWHESMVVYKRHRKLRELVFTKRIFWKDSHYFLCRVAVAAALPRRLRFLRAYLVFPYLRNIELRRRRDEGRLIHTLYYPIEDAVEVVAMVRASIRHRMLVL